MQKKICSYGDFCSFEHNINHPEELNETEDTLQQKLDYLEMVIMSKDVEIEKLRRKFEADTNDASNNSESETSTSEGENVFNCEMCEFRTNSESGLKIHIGKVHKEKCERCDKTFRSREKLNRHIKAKEMLDNIDPKESKHLDMKLKPFREDEKCFGIFKDSDSEIHPILILHCEECWTGTDSFCADLPGKPTTTDTVMMDKLDNSPTLHMLLSLVVLGDLTLAGCFVDWDCLQKILRENKMA